LAAAAALVVFDKLFGLSSSWMRFMSALQELERILDVFRLHWGIQAAALEEEYEIEKSTDALRLILGFIEEIHGVVKQETDLWMNEFQSGLIVLERHIAGQNRAKP
jgi:hypothetical protein